MFSRISRKMASESGSFTSNVIFLAIVVAILTVVTLDSFAIFKAYQSAGNVSEEAARAAMFDWKVNRSDARAGTVAQQYCEDKGLQFVNFEVQPEGHYYKVTCSTDAQTYVFWRLPGLKNLIHQENIGTASETD